MRVLDHVSTRLQDHELIETPLYGGGGHLFRSVLHSDTNWYQLYLDGTAAQLTVAVDQAMAFDILLIGITQGCTRTFYSYGIGFVVNDGGTIAVEGAFWPMTEYPVDSGDFDARVNADVVNDALLIEVTDTTGGGDTVRWSAVVRTTEVTFPA